MVYRRDQSSVHSLLSCIRMTAIIICKRATVYCLLAIQQYIENLSEILEKYLVHLSNWFKASKVSLNISKTNMIFVSRIDVLHFDALFITMDGIKLRPVKSVQFIGLHIDHKLDSKYTQITLKVNYPVACTYGTQPNIFWQQVT